MFSQNMIDIQQRKKTNQQGLCSDSYVENIIF